MEAIKAASVQFNHAPGDKDANMDKVRSFVADAAARNVDLVCFPEMCITGYWHVRNLSRDEIAELAEPVPSGPSTQVWTRCFAGSTGWSMMKFFRNVPPV